MAEQKPGSVSRPVALDHYPLQPLAVIERDEDSGIFAGMLLDLTTRGTKLISGERFQKDAKLSLRIKLHEGKEYSLRGKVRWAKRIADIPSQHEQSGNYLHEIEFADLKGEVSRALLDYVAGCLFAELEERDRYAQLESIQHRRYLRVPVTLTIFCKDEDHTPFSINTIDLSGGGTHFQTNHPVSSGDVLTVEIQPDLTVPLIVAKGKIIWSRRLDETNYEGGLEFVEIAPDTRKALVQLLIDML